MRSLLVILPYLTLVGLAQPIDSAGQNTDRVGVEGTLVNGVTGEPIQGAEIVLAELGLRVVSDPAGRFRLSDVPMGTFHLSVSAPGFMPIDGSLQVDKAGSMTFTLQPLEAPTNTLPGQVRGTVTATPSSNPLEGAVVSITGSGLGALTDSKGRFVIRDVPAGRHILRTEHLGFSPRADSLVIGDGQLVTVEIGLALQPVELAPISVVVEWRMLRLDMARFYDRRQAGQGAFLSRQEIEAKLPLFSSDLFEGLPGVRVVGGGGPHKAVLLRAGLRASSGGVMCAPALWVDGMLVARAGGDGAYVDRFARPSELAGVEVYTSVATTPLQYRSPGMDCGVMVLWTR